jgi:hypothetical protein
MQATNRDFTQSALITAARITANPEEALSLAPEGIAVPDGLNPYQRGLLYELNRFPGSTTFAFVPEGEARETVLASVEANARAYEESTGRHLRNPVPVPGYFTVAVYIRNLRELFLVADIDDGRPLPEGNPLMVDVPSTLSFLTDPKNAVKFALARLEEFEVPAFLRDWQEGLCLKGWLEGLNEDQADAVEMYRESAALA